MRVNTRPPTRSLASSTATVLPLCVSSRAAARPAAPAPITIVSGFVMSRRFHPAGAASSFRQQARMMRIGGVSAADLARAYGTPLLAIDYDVLDRAVGSFLNACEPYGIEVAYAGKALLLTALAKHLKHTRLQLDVCSLGELAAAERAGFPPERLTLHGCGKT